LIARRIDEIKSHGVVAAASLTPQKVRKHYEVALEAGLDILVIQGTVVSAEPEEKEDKVVDLMEALRRSLEGGSGSREKAERFLAAHGKKKPKRKSSTRKRAA